VTTVVMVQTPDDVLLGWDSLMTRGNEVSVMVQPKVVVNDGIIYGVSGTSRAIDFFKSGAFPPYNDEADIHGWIIGEWAPAVRELVGEDKTLVDPEDGRFEFGVSMVVRGQAFGVDSVGSPWQTQEGIYTMGSGGDYARGVLYANRQAARAVQDQLNENDVMVALRAAAEIDPYTGGGLTVARASNLIK
jgi:ATP-dependent protease HslVU (ClpYQ) peptidase subunit